MSEESGENEKLSLYFSVFAGLLMIVFILAKALHEAKFLNSYISEASLVLIFGMATGSLVAYLNELVDKDGSEVFADDAFNEDGATHLADRMLSFSPDLFFMALLPPILFNSGYQLRRELFYRHIKPIILLATVGTIFSALATGFGLAQIQRMGGFDDFRPTLLELLTFGSLIAATDTVSVISSLSAKKCDPKLFYMIFGESALNDAVSLVLYSTFSKLLLSEDYDLSISDQATRAFTSLAVQAILSPAVGFAFSFLVALIFKYIDFREQRLLEMSLHLLTMYVPYTIAETFELSGIVSIFFAGISSRRYIAPNLSVNTQNDSESLFKVAAYLAEIVIFLELGLSVPGFTGRFKWDFVFWALFCSLVARAIAVYPLVFLYNVSLRRPIPVVNPLTCAEVESVDTPVETPIGYRRTVSDTSISVVSNPLFNPDAHSLFTWPGTHNYEYKTPAKRQDKKISLKMAHMICFAGLRGAVAYACVRDFPNVYNNRHEFIATTICIVLFTVIIMGGLVETLLDAVGIETGIDEDEYMKQWHQQHQLRGTFHDFEHNILYREAVRDHVAELGPVMSYKAPTETKAGEKTGSVSGAGDSLSDITEERTEPKIV